MLIDGFGIGGYRSFGPVLQKIGPLSKLTLFVGQNNSGKSNVLRFAHEHYRDVARRAGQNIVGNLGFETLDGHLPQPCPLAFAWALRSDHPAYTWAREILRGQNQEHILDQIIDIVSDDSGLSWFHFVASSLDADRWEVDNKWLETIVAKNGDPAFWQNPARVLSDAFSGDPRANAARLVTAICRAAPAPPNVALVPAIREIGTGSIEDGDFSGRDIINRLADLQHPAIHQQEKRTRFKAINEFVQTVLDEPDAEIEIPVQHDTIHVQLGQHRLPLEHLGTGIHEVTMLAAWATILEDHLLCIEEPELHLHPLLQRKLLNYLTDRTSNQYLITTHSAHILEHPDATVFHVRWDGSQSIVHRVLTSVDRRLICNDLGYQASDLLQANAIVWVEGPSDRIYVRHWLKAVDPSLVEGIHYSLMFYGGRLLSHLSADDPEVDDFISLRRINQHLAILIDSDKSSPQKPLNETKKRIQSEFDRGPGFAWITKGREIENYLPVDLLMEAVRSVHGSDAALNAVGQYDDVVEYRSSKRSNPRGADKVKVARAVVEREADVSMLDLREQVQRLATFIREANGMR